MKFLVTGGNRGLGQKICEMTGGFSASRESGFDIASENGRKQIASLSLEYDIIVNNAFDGPPQTPGTDMGQVKLLGEIYNLWKEHKKPGYIINIGSIASLFPIRVYQNFQLYRVSKLALDQASCACTRAFLSSQVPFRTSLVRFGRLDTPISRSRENWTGHGHDLTFLSESIFHLARAPLSTCAYTLDLDVRLQEFKA